MNPKDRQKMCSSCDGRIPFDTDVCPYCASEQKGGSPVPAASSAKELHHQSLQDSLTSLYSPPFAGKSAGPTHSLMDKKGLPLNKNQFESPQGPMAEKRFNNPSVALGVPTIPAHASEEHPVEEDKSSFWPILLLSIGANLLTLGLIQLLFSDDGFLRLEWDSSYWFVYCLVAFPLFFFGFKKANALKN